MATIDGKEINPSPWLKSPDIGYDQSVFHIQAVGFEEVGRDKETKAVVDFVETSKRLILNKTNEATLERLYGPQAEGWVGKAINAYHVVVEAGGEQFDAIRLRVVQSAVLEPGEPEPVPF